MATVRYLVKDVDAALAFYSALGFILVERWGPPFAMISRGDLTLWLSGPGASASKPLADGSVPVPDGWNRLVIEVEDIHAAIEALCPTGARLRSEPIRGPGGQQVLVEDPSGNPVELFEAKQSWPNCACLALGQRRTGLPAIGWCPFAWRTRHGTPECRQHRSRAARADRSRLDRFRDQRHDRRMGIHRHRVAADRRGGALPAVFDARHLDHIALIGATRRATTRA